MVIFLALFKNLNECVDETNENEYMHLGNLKRNRN